MSATSSCTGVCCLLMLVSPGTCKSCHFSSQSQNLGRQNTETEVIFKIFDHNRNKFQFVSIIWNLREMTKLMRELISDMHSIKSVHQNETVEVEKRKKKRVVYFLSFLCLLFCIVMAIFSQCSSPSVGM